MTRRAPLEQMPRVALYGITGQTPYAGVAWQALHYIEGFRRLGCDVYYVEDTGDWPYDPSVGAVTASSDFTLDYLARTMRRVGLESSWAYRGPDGCFRGPLADQVARVLDATDILINLTGSTWLMEEHLRVPRRVLVETDPVLPQISIALGDEGTTILVENHTHWFTYGENIATGSALTPPVQFPCHATRQPVILDWWQPQTSPSTPLRWTTVGNWKQSGKDVTWKGETYFWSKHHEFLKFLSLPERTQQVFELALAGDLEAKTVLTPHGWHVRPAETFSRDMDQYRAYVRESGGEFTVAKDQNVRLRSGWFSDRSATYLAAGRPVVTQDTGFSEALPCGAGLFAFSTLAEAAAAVEAVRGAYGEHMAAARELAREYFAADRVLASLLERIER